MSRIYIFSIILFSVSILIAEPIKSYETGPVHIYSNLNNNWWQDRALASYKQPYMTDKFAAYDSKIGENSSLNSYLASNVNNLNLGNTEYRRVQNQDSWRFVNGKKAAGSNLSSNTAANTRKNNGTSGDPQYNGMASDTQSTGGFAGGFSAGYFLRDNGHNSSKNYYLPVNVNPTPTNQDIPVAPAPGSILLGALGIAIVGFLRNKKVKLLS